MKMRSKLPFNLMEKTGPQEIAYRAQDGDSCCELVVHKTENYSPQNANLLKDGQHVAAMIDEPTPGR